MSGDQPSGPEPKTEGWNDLV